MVIMAGFNQNHKKPIQVRCSVGHRMTFLAMFQIMFHTYKKPCQCLIIFDLLDGDKQYLYDRLNEDNKHLVCSAYDNRILVLIIYLHCNQSMYRYYVSCGDT